MNYSPDDHFAFNQCALDNLMTAVVLAAGFDSLIRYVTSADHLARRAYAGGFWDHADTYNAPVFLRGFVHLARRAYAAGFWDHADTYNAPVFLRGFDRGRALADAFGDGR